jgi:transposase
MRRAYSLDLRERVFAAVAGGESCRSVAATFKVSAASVVKWSQRFRATGSAAARPMGGNRPYALSSERDWLLERLAEQPDITLRAMLAELAERGIKGQLLDGVALNLGSHKGKTVRRAIRTAGAKLLFLPPYSPDLNPIEQAFAKLKTLLRRLLSEPSRQPGSAPAFC